MYKIIYIIVFNNLFMLKIILIVVSIIFTFFVQANTLVTTHLLCANDKGTEWDWANWSNGDYIELKGYWGSLQYKGKWIGYFTVDNKQYELLSECSCFTEQCLNYFPHPADALNNYWYLIRNADTKKFSGGYYTKFNYNPFPT
ncbi:hypothetical protein BS333_17320 [Vibrio azureus]|uniref:hypothetical protein n=1 Tax=Vibrio azureus TaxID=512649 RepID=UPI000C7DA271|nr:hypothetical protein [Vibrio azureus]AUI88121.1 hypothetical protein BS333_17320 [Vibrio azureus]